jgi:N utilization substance protein A
VQSVVDELFGEKIDIIAWTENREENIMNALSPAKVEKVISSEEENGVTAIVPDYQLSLAIGKEGQNVRLAAKLCAVKIDIKSHTQYYGDPQTGAGLGGELDEDGYLNPDDFMTNEPDSEDADAAPDADGIDAADTDATPDTDNPVIEDADAAPDTDGINAAGTDAAPDTDKPVTEDADATPDADTDTAPDTDEPVAEDADTASDSDADDAGGNAEDTKTDDEAHGEATAADTKGDDEE